MTDMYSLDSFVYFDIETIPCQDPAYLDELRKSVTAPAQYKKQDSIEKWIEENGEQAALDALARTSFNATRGHVCTISWAKNSGDVQNAHAENVSDEADVIQQFFDSLDEYHSETLVGHYITGFDIPFLLKRAVILGVRLPGRSVFPRDPKPWDKTVNDTMTMWSGAKDRISMDNLCEALGLKGKGDFDGSMVAAAWANGEHAKIREYCDDDVRRTRYIHQRFLKVGW